MTGFGAMGTQRPRSGTSVLGMIDLAVGSSAMARGGLPVLPTLPAAIGLQTIHSALLAERGTP